VSTGGAGHSVCNFTKKVDLCQLSTKLAGHGFNNLRLGRNERWYLFNYEERFSGGFEDRLDPFPLEPAILIRLVLARLAAPHFLNQGTMVSRGLK
jgi:hypothetical protein